jgi:hypothetical protein
MGAVSLSSVSVYIENAHYSREVGIVFMFTQTFFSDWCKLRRGIPKESVLGLLLFLNYINEPVGINLLQNE